MKGKSHKNLITLYSLPFFLDTKPPYKQMNYSGSSAYSSTGSLSTHHVIALTESQHCITHSKLTSGTNQPNPKMTVLLSTHPALRSLT